jgi:hypothetical protein
MSFGTFNTAEGGFNTVIPFDSVSNNINSAGANNDGRIAEADFNFNGTTPFDSLKANNDNQVEGGAIAGGVSLDGFGNYVPSNDFIYIGRWRGNVSAYKYGNDVTSTLTPETASFVVGTPSLLNGLGGNPLTTWLRYNLLAGVPSYLTAIRPGGSTVDYAPGLINSASVALNPGTGSTQAQVVFSLSPYGSSSGGTYTLQGNWFTNSNLGFTNASNTGATCLNCVNALGAGNPNGNIGTIAVGESSSAPYGFIGLGFQSTIVDQGSISGSALLGFSQFEADYNNIPSKVSGLNYLSARSVTPGAPSSFLPTTYPNPVDVSFGYGKSAQGIYEPGNNDIADYLDSNAMATSVGRIVSGGIDEAGHASNDFAYLGTWAGSSFATGTLIPSPGMTAKGMVFVLGNQTPNAYLLGLGNTTLQYSLVDATAQSFVAARPDGTISANAGEFTSANLSIQPLTGAASLLADIKLYGSYAGIPDVNINLPNSSFNVGSSPNGFSGVFYATDGTKIHTSGMIIGDHAQNAGIGINLDNTSLGNISGAAILK